MAPSVLFGPDTMNAPWGLESKLKLVASACYFFNFETETVEARHRAIGKAIPKEGVPELFSLADFLTYLDVTGAFAKTPNGLRVARVLDEMTSAGLLIHAGSSKPSLARLNDCYLFMASAPETRRGMLRWVPVLGPEYLYKLCAPGLVHITGLNTDGGAVAGTGLVVHPFHVLTCRHAICDMRVDRNQTFQGQEYVINDGSVFPHPEVDVAVVRVDGPALTPVEGVIFHAPIVAQTVYTLGYPKLPGLRDASVTMQQGSVTNESVTSLSGERLFLYSAIARPGNSGGPVMSSDGYVVGLSIVDARAEYHADEAFSPHYAGIPAEVVVEAVASLRLGIQLPFETYE